MAQAAFEFSPLVPTALPAALPGTTPAAAATATLDACGFAIGWDHAHHRVTPPLAHLNDHNPVGQGWAAGRAAFGERRLRTTAAVRQWLALRLRAWQDGAVFEDQQVNPAFLARIDVPQCPVTRAPLLLATGGSDDATVVRLNTAAAYAAGNLAVLSQQAAQAWGPGDWAAAQAQAVALADSGGRHLGLDAAAWQRLVVLASFATPLPHAQAALLPLRVLPPNRVRVINPVQALQVMLTLQFSQAGYARRLLGLSALVPGSEARQAFQIFMHTLLARRLAVGPQPTPQQLRQAMEDTWGDVLVQRRWQRLASRLGAADCELLLQRASQRGLVVGGGRWLSADAATDGWALAAPAQADGVRRQSPLVAGRRPAAAQATAAGVPPALVARPGSARRRGSQKAASCAGLTDCSSRQ
ncbi:hypothetical protein [Pseudaquabacterium pictum]|uniref:Uncharacterized protein n=1 Tax=Pseudaquabacterium pictum TaxID=2315236 RepID=A0A480AHH0_9BURK|nr:hypothetical protein [Rubrivivax pictus]GCL61084.1 hypothetical protein AQPW35_01650 [Rubrivivax pictus]